MYSIILWIFPVVRNINIISGQRVKIKVKIKRIKRKFLIFFQVTLLFPKPKTHCSDHFFIFTLIWKSWHEEGPLQHYVYEKAKKINCFLRTSLKIAARWGAKACVWSHKTPFPTQQGKMTGISSGLYPAFLTNCTINKNKKAKVVSGLWFQSQFNDSLKKGRKCFQCLSPGVCKLFFFFFFLNPGNPSNLEEKSWKPLWSYFRFISGL